MISSIPSRPHEFPDPLLTANIYCEGRLDELIQRAVTPFWEEFQESDPEGLCRLWLVRYARCGEHLKVRLHGPEELRPEMERRLAAAVEPFLTEIGGREPRDRPSRTDVPPIDAEDRELVDYPDRTLLWTHYQRSHVSLPGKPYLSEDGFVARFTACLGQACERALRALQAEEAGKVSTRTRQTSLLKGLISGLAASGFPPEARAAYLAYHRDWLVRFNLQRNGADAAKAADVLNLFDEQARKMGPALERLGKAAGAEWQAAQEGGGGDEWRSSLAQLIEYVTPWLDNPDYRIDPFATHPVFSPVFKAFHGFANQLGLAPMDEGFTHHLLLRAAFPEGERSA